MVKFHLLDMEIKKEILSLGSRIKSLLLYNQTTRQTVAKNTFWLTAGTITSRIVRAGLIIYAARVLGAGGYGIFSYALSIAAFFTLFADVGISPLLTREITKNPQKASSYTSTAFGLKLILMLGTAAVIALAAPLFTKIPEAKTLLPIVAILLIFDNLRNFGFSITRAQNRMEIEAAFTILTDVFITGIGVIILLFAPSARGLAVGYAAGSGVGFALLFVSIRSQLKNLFAHFDAALIKPILRAAWPFAIMGLLGGFMLDIDIIIIGWFRTANELGLYGAAQRFIQVIYLIPTFLAISLFPIVSNLVSKSDHEHIRSIVERSLAIIFMVAFPVVVGGIIVSNQIINLLLGAEYSGATLTLQILFITTFLVFPNWIIGNVIFAYDRQKVFSVSTALGASANVAFDLLLIPLYGNPGSAIATIIAHITVASYNWVKMNEINRLTVFPKLKKMAAAAIIMGIVTLAIRYLGVPVLVNIAVSAVLYFALLVLFKEPLLSKIKRVILRLE